MRINCIKKQTIIFLFVAFLAFSVFATEGMAAPILNFSDIDSGPKTGNTDGVGSGAIVTIWGNNLGENQGTSKVYVGAVEATAIYYWKDANGKLPGGPADLYTYHKMQEIAFAIPSGASDGANKIKVIVGGVSSNTLPFTIRSGDIHFIKSGGSDSNAGTWSSPWSTLNGAMDGAHASTGDTVYSVGIGSTSGIKGGGVQTLAGKSGSPISLITYPNTKVAVSGLGGDSSVIDNWYPSNRKSQYVNFSKISVTCSGNSGDPSNGVSVFPYNRIVGLEITGPTVYGGYGGAITGTSGVPQGGVYLGIYIHDYGYPTSYSYNWDSGTWTSPPYNGIGDACTNCTSVDRFQHLYYISNRVSASALAYEIGWNYCTDNPILHGIHIYDMGSVGGWTGTMKIHHNVVKNQRGAAIDVSFPTASAMEIHDNIIIVDADERYNHGPAFDIIGAASAKVYNNTVYGYSNYNRLAASTLDYRNNIMVDTRGVSFLSNEPSSHSNNLFYSTSATAKPSWASSGLGDINANPLFIDPANYNFALSFSSPAINAGADSVITVSPTDFMGQSRRTGSVSIGAFEYADSSQPIPPENPKGLKSYNQ